MMEMGGYYTNMTPVLLAEAVFGVVSVILAFMTIIYNGGRFSQALMFIAIGQILMSLGHIIMAADLYFHTDTFAQLFGLLGTLIFRIIVALSLLSSIIGFYKLYKSGK